jgi:hypothetical protein
MMKSATWILAAAVVPSLLMLTVGAAEGQGNSGASQGKNPAGATQDAENAQTTGQNQAAAAQVTKPKKPGKPEQAIQPAGNGSSAEVREMVKEFRDQQKARLEEYRRLAAQARDATAEKRQQLRQQLRQMLEEQKAERDQLREQVRERLQELTTSLPSRKEVIEAAKEQAREKQDRGRGE